MGAPVGGSFGQAVGIAMQCHSGISCVLVLKRSPSPRSGGPVPPHDSEGAHRALGHTERRVTGAARSQSSFVPLNYPSLVAESTIAICMRAADPCQAEPMREFHRRDDLSFVQHRPAACRSVEEVKSR